MKSLNFKPRILGILLSIFSYATIIANAQGIELGGKNTSRLGRIYHLTTDAGGSLYASGELNNAKGYGYVAKWSGNSWSELGGVNSLPTALNFFCIPCTTVGSIGRIITTIDASGNLYAGGAIANGKGFYDVAKYNGSSWSVLGGLNTSTFYYPIYALTSDASGNLYAGGDFSNANGEVYVAKWNGSGWSALGSFKKNGSGYPGTINVINTDVSGNVYASDGMANASGKYYLALWNGITWDELGGAGSSTFNNPIRTTFIANGNLYAAGGFTNGVGKYYVAKWNGSNWSELGGVHNSTFDGPIESIVADGNGNIYAGGWFKNANNQYYIAKFNGNSWSEFGSIYSHSIIAPTRSIAIDTKGNLYAAGDISNDSGYTYVAKLSAGSLPLQLTSFAASRLDKGLQLKWATANETNTTSYVIESSIDGKSFSEVASVYSKGSGNNNYSINLTAFHNYYRLKMLEKNGSYTYSKVVSVDVSTAKNQLSIYPNPVKATLSASIHSGVEENVLVAVSDMQGKVLIQNKQKLGVGNNLISVDTHQLAKGNYLLVIKGKGVTQNQFIKE